MDIKQYLIVSYHFFVSVQPSHPSLVVSAWDKPTLFIPCKYIVELNFEGFEKCVLEASVFQNFYGKALKIANICDPILYFKISSPFTNLSLWIPHKISKKDFNNHFPGLL
jgi:hypothetical protein